MLNRHGSLEGLGVLHLTITTVHSILQPPHLILQPPHSVSQPLRPSTSMDRNLNSSSSSSSEAEAKPIALRLRANNSQCRLLSLSAELRNIIYDLVLNERYVGIGRPWPEVPGLLRTCKQIRREASSMFYDENFFLLHTEDLKMQPHRGHWFWRHASGNMYGINNRGEIKWCRVLAWTRLYHTGVLESTRLQLDNCESHGVANIIKSAFGVAKTLRGAPWSSVKHVLGLYRKAVEEAQHTSESLEDIWDDKNGS